MRGFWRINGDTDIHSARIDYPFLFYFFQSFTIRQSFLPLKFG